MVTVEPHAVARHCAIVSRVLAPAPSCLDDHGHQSLPLFRQIEWISRLLPNNHRSSASGRPQFLADAAQLHDLDHGKEGRRRCHLRPSLGRKRPRGQRAETQATTRTTYDQKRQSPGRCRGRHIFGLYRNRGCECAGKWLLPRRTVTTTVVMIPKVPVRSHPRPAQPGLRAP